MQPACRWCALPTSDLCVGLAEAFCRNPLCTDCERSLLRCPGCVEWLGFPPAWQAGSGIPEAAHYTAFILPMLARQNQSWEDIWAGVSDLEMRAFNG